MQRAKLTKATRVGGIRIKSRRPKPKSKVLPTPDFSKVLTAEEAREEYEKKREDAKAELVGESGRKQSGATKVEKLTKNKMQEAADAGHTVYKIEDPGTKHGYTTQSVVAIFRATRECYKRFRKQYPTIAQNLLRQRMMEMKNDAGHAIRAFSHHMPTGFQMATEESMMSKEWEEFIEFQLTSMIEAKNGKRNMAATKREINRRYRALTTRRTTKDDERKAVTIMGSDAYKEEHPDSRKDRRTMNKHGLE